MEHTACTAGQDQPSRWHMTTRACLMLKQHQTHTPTRSTPYALLALHPALTNNQSWEKRLFKEGISLVDNFDTPFVFAAAVFSKSLRVNIAASPPCCYCRKALVGVVRVTNEQQVYLWVCHCCLIQSDDQL